MGGIVGRHREMGAILDLVKAARSRRESTIFVRGEAGIGKSRLVEEILEQAQLLGYTVLSGRAEELERSVPYAALREALEPALRSERSVQLGDAVEAVDRALQLRPQPSRDQETGRTTLQLLYAEGERLLRAWSDRQPVVLAIDDLHAADRDTLSVVSLLSRHLTESRVVIIGALRLHAPDRNIELDALVHRLCESGRAVTVDLEVLDRDDVKTMLGTSLGGPASDDLVDHVWNLSRGNPFFAEESLNALSAAGAIVHDSGSFSLAPQAPIVSASRRSTVLHRVFRLGRTVRAVARIASALQTLRLDRVDLLSELVQIPTVEVVEALDTLVEANILRPATSDHLEFVHPIVRSTLYDDLGPVERRRVHAVTAEYLRRVAPLGRRVTKAEIAIHLTESAEPGDVDAAQVLVEAGDDAAHSAPLSAASMYEHALHLLPAGHPLLGEVLARLARAQFLSGRFDDASTSGRAALDRLPHGRIAGRTAALAVSSLISAHRFPEALELAERVLSTAKGPIARVRTQRATILLYLDRFEEAREEGELALASAGSDRVATAGALGLLGGLAFAEGRLEDSLSLLDRQLEVSNEVGPVALLSTLVERTTYLGLFGLLPEAEDAFMRASKLSIELGEAPFRSTLQVAGAIIDWLAGRWDDAMARWATVKGSESEFQVGAIARCAVIAILCERGRLSEAREEAAAFEASPFAHSFTSWTRAVLASAEGNDELALDLLRAAVSTDLVTGRRSALHLLLSLQAEIELATGDSAAAEETAALLGTVGRDIGSPSMLAAALRTVAVVNGHAESAAEALTVAEGSGLAVEVARCCAVLGRLGVDPESNLRRALDGFTSFAAEPARRAVASDLRRLGLSVPRAKRQPGTTTTDWQLAALVHDGLTNRQIARTLHLSPKTVEVYLTRLFAKIGVANRLELALAFAEGRVTPPAAAVTQ